MIATEIRDVLIQDPCGLVFDIDGTISSIAPTPDEAQLYPGVAKLLEQAKKQVQVGIITGRAVVDGARLVNIDGITYIGTHGLEWSDGFPSLQRLYLIPEALAFIEPGERLMDLAEQQLASIPEIIILRKSVGGSIHYRLAANPEQTRERIFALLTEPARQLHMRLGEGKRVVEVLAPLAVNKGHALRRYVEHFDLHGVIFAGDDLTDLDAILEIKHLRQQGLHALSIVVQHPDTLPALLEHADRVVQGVEGMAQLLEDMVRSLPDTTSH